MEPIDPRVLRFLKKHHIFTLATTHEGKPWCCTCFYVFDIESLRLIFTSDKETRHIAEGIQNQEVSGTVALETRVIGRLRGIQFSGILTEMVGDDYEASRKTYLKRFPYATPWLGKTAIWSVSLLHLKMTDNRLGFGKKIIWYKST